MDKQPSIDKDPFVNDLANQPRGMPSPPEQATGPFKIEGTFHFVGQDGQPMEPESVFKAASQFTNVGAEPSPFRVPPSPTQPQPAQQPLSIRHGIEEVRGAAKQKVSGAKGAVKEAQLGNIWNSKIFIGLCKWFWIFPLIETLACFKVFYLPLFAALLSLGAMFCIKKNKTRIARLLTLASIGLCAMTPIVNLIVGAVVKK